jgi:predicted ATPase
VEGVLKALRAAECRRFEVDELPYATPSALIRRLRARPPDIIHFVGHGDVLASGSALVFESGRPHEEAMVYADEFADMLVQAGVRFVVLSGCMTGAPQIGVGAHAVAAGIAGAVAMQFPIGDRAAYGFALAMYSAIASGSEIEQAVHSGRMAIRKDGCHWGVPVVLVAPDAGSIVLGAEAVDAAPLKHNLPDEDRVFVGRSREIRELKQAIVKKGRRLVTITGMGGMGKTRLAKQVGRLLVDSFRDGVWLVECESLSTESELRASIAAALGADDAATSWEALAAAIGDSHLLLVLDCFERLVSVAEQIDLLLRSTRNLQILVSSRVVIGLAREVEHSLGPMSLARRSARLPEGIDLFLDAASHANSDFQVTRQNRRALTQLVEELEAVPLAIMLAAGRLKHLSLEDLRERVATQRVDVLKRRPIGDDRHANLLRVVDDSLRLLTPEERALAVRLSVFHGGFFLDDAVEVLSDELDLLDRVSVLRDNSLLTAQVVDGRMRFRILDTVRESIERLADAGELDKVRLRHAAYYSQAAARLRQIANEGRGTEANAWLRRDAGNFRAAISFSVDRKDSQLIRSFGASLARAYFESGARSDFDLVSVAADRHAIADGDDRLRIELLGLQGALYRREKDFARARDVWLQRSRIGERLQDFDVVADSLLDVADLALQRGDYETVGAMLNRVSGFGDRVKDMGLRTGETLLRAKFAIANGDLSAALGLAERAEQLLEEISDSREAGYIWLSLSQIYRTAGKPEESMQLSRRMIARSLESGYIHYAARAVLELSTTLEELGRIDEAVFALALASSVPASASPAVRSDATRKLKTFVGKHGPEIVKSAAQKVEAAPWDELAMSLGEIELLA